MTHEIARAARLSDAALVPNGGHVVHESRGEMAPAALESAYERALEDGS